MLKNETFLNFTVYKIQKFVFFFKKMFQSLPGILHQLSKMNNSFLLQIFRAIDASEHSAVRKLLASPFFNQRRDVQDLFDLLVSAQKRGSLPTLTREATFAKLFPGKPFHNLTLNHTFSYLTGRLKKYLALEEMQRDQQAESLYRLRAFRRRGLSQLFERGAQMLEKEHFASTYRHAGWHLFHYQLQNEVFSHRIVQRRGGATNLQIVADALGNFFMLENLRWACTAHALRSVGGSGYRLPLGEAVREAADQTPVAENPALALLANSLRALQHPDDEASFQTITELLHRYPDLFPPAENRDIYMAAINFCIRRQNQGDRTYARAALNLYREALARDILLENGVLPPYTYNNIHLLAQVTGENTWARTFLDQYRDALPFAGRDNIYRYNVAIAHFRSGEYGRVLGLLQEVTFSEIFINLDVRRMLLKSYFEMGEWLSLASLLDSFAVFIRRQKELGYHRESYLNLIKFTKKLAKNGSDSQLAETIRNTASVAEREWLLEKATGRAIF